MSESFGARARKFMGWYSPDAEDDEFDDYDDMEEVAPVADITPATRPSLAPVRRPEPIPSEELSRILPVHATAFSDARVIGEAFREGTPVILDRADVSYQESRRLVDFAAGLTFGLRGVLESVTDRVFLLSPKNVEIPGEAMGARRGALYNQG